METNVIPAWHYIWKCLYWWLLPGCQISCLFSKSADSTEILSDAAGLYGTIMEFLSLSRRRSSARNVPSGEVVRKNGCFCRPAIIGSTPHPLPGCYTITLAKSFAWRLTKHKQLVASHPKDFVGKNKQTNNNEQKPLLAGQQSTETSVNLVWNRILPWKSEDFLQVTDPTCSNMLSRC